MRALKTILIIMIALGALILVLGLVGPKTYHVERMVEIDASPAVVYSYVSYVGKMKEWGPWQELDKDQLQTIEGTDGSVGAIWKWEGDTVGSGMQEITELAENEQVRSKLTFFVPVMGQANSTSTYDLDPTESGTRITWSIEGENSFLARAMGVFMNLDAKLGPDLDHGLANLSTLAGKEQRRIETEREESTFNGYYVDILERPLEVYLGKRAVVPFMGIRDFYATSLDATTAAARLARLQTKGHPSGIYFAWNEKTAAARLARLQTKGHPSGIYFAWNEKIGNADLLAGMPVAADSNLTVADMQVYTVPASTMAHVAFYGDYADLSSAHQAITAMIEARGYTEYGIRMEEYVTDRASESDPKKWLTNVYCMVR